jgi:hypothetical protein
MSISVIGTTSFAGVSTPSAGLNTTGASLLVCHFWNQDSGKTIVDNKGNTWTSRPEQSNGPFFSYGRVFYVESPTVGSGHTFQSNDGNTPVGIVIALAGTKASSSFDQQIALMEPPSHNPPVNIGTSLTPSENNCIVLALLAGFPENGSHSINGGYTIAADVPGAGGVNYGAALAYLIQTTATATDPTWTDTSGGSTENVVLQLISFKAAAGGSFIPAVLPRLITSQGNL